MMTMTGIFIMTVTRNIDVHECHGTITDFLFVFVFTLCIWGVVLCIVSVIFKQHLLKYHVRVAADDSIVVSMCC